MGTLRERSVSYETYLQDFKSIVDGKSEKAFYESPYWLDYTRANYERMQRFGSRFRLNKKLYNLLIALDQSLTIYCITEPWCGDAAFALPALECFTEVNPGLIELRIIYRDASPEIMDNHLTNGARAIPKVLLADEQETVLWAWGPRPSTLQQLVGEWLTQGATKEEKLKNTTQWYLRDQGETIQKDWIEGIQSIK
ncbi:MAG: thioredoxin family protein [Bacteroidota bacterium]|nr:thioredoxin family protein [Bacteroidota bacterium]